MPRRSTGLEDDAGHRAELFTATPPPADEIDASGMAMMVYMVGGSVVAGALLLTGLPASLLTLRRLRGRKAET
jgi:hypothetical protein